MIAIAVAYVLAGVLGSEIMKFTSQGGAPIVYAKKSSEASRSRRHATDVEKEAAVFPNHESSGSEADIVSHEGLALTWKDLTVDIGDMQILKGISGYVRPGDFIALCGASGAGKTTLLTALSQTNFAGKLGGEIMFGGKEPGRAFKKATGWQPPFA
jgi:ABC-type transport system involved in cytochrome bd biosynthesis fused ATPase/permease subunit